MIKYNPEKIDAWVRYGFPYCRGWAVDQDGAVHAYEVTPHHVENAWWDVGIGYFVSSEICHVDLGTTDWRDTWHEVGA